MDVEHDVFLDQEIALVQHPTSLPPATGACPAPALDVSSGMDLGPGVSSGGKASTCRAMASMVVKARSSESIFIDREREREYTDSVLDTKPAVGLEHIAETNDQSDENVLPATSWPTLTPIH